MKDQYIKYGGIKFEQKASAKEINNYVEELPGDQKDSLFEVSKALDEAGLINMLNQVTTIDDEMIDAQKTE